MRKIKKTWEEWYQIACEYAKYHSGSIATICATYKTSEGYALGTWIFTQRQAYKNRSIPKEQRTNTYNPLTDEQVQKLEAIGMIWKYNKTWDDWYQLACQYAEKHGGSIITIFTTYITENGDFLGSWIAKQRQAYKNRTIPKEQRKNTLVPLTDEQVQKLEAIGMVWEGIIDKRDELTEYYIKDAWNKAYELACEYAKNHNGSISSISSTYKTAKGDFLGLWIVSQRKAYRNRSIPKEKRKNNLRPLTDEQVQKLEAIGIIWEVSKTWDEWYKLACKYAEKHGGSIASLSTLYVTEQGDALGTWIHHQRQAYDNRSIPKEERKNSYIPLTDEQVRKLEAIGIIWNRLENTNKIFDICKNYDIDFNQNEKILKKISASFLEAKINYCLKNDIPITINGYLNEIFTMSSANLYAKHGITLEELMNSHKLKLEKGN